MSKNFEKRNILKLKRRRKEKKKRGKEQKRRGGDPAYRSVNKKKETHETKRMKN